MRFKPSFLVFPASNSFLKYALCQKYEMKKHRSLYTSKNIKVNKRFKVLNL